MVLPIQRPQRRLALAASSAAQTLLGVSQAQQRRKHPVDAVGRHDHVPAAGAAAYVRVLALGLEVEDVAYRPIGHPRLRT